MAKLKGGSRVYGTLTVDDALTVSDNVTVTGNLTVTGDTIYTNVTTLAIQDPLISLGAAANAGALLSNDGKDRGSLLSYYDTSAKTAFMGWDNSAGQFAVASNVSVSSEVVGDIEYANLRALGFIGEGSSLANIAGANVTGTVASANMSSYAGIVVNASQPNITSLGTLTGLVVGNGSANTTFGNGTITATGAVSTGNLTVNGDGNVTGNLTIGGTLFANVSGTTSAPGSNTQVVFNDAGTSNAVAGMTFNKSGNALTVTGTITGGNLSTGGTLSVTGDSNVGNLGASGLITATGNVSGGNITTAGVVSATGNVDGNHLNAVASVTAANATITNNITATNGNVSAGNNVTATGNVSGNNVSATHRVSTANLTITGDVTGHLIPNADVTYDLGNATNKWRDLYLSGTSIKLGEQTITSNSTRVNISGGFYANGALEANGNITSTNANLGNLATANFFTGTLTTAAQPNITSVGNLSSLNVDGNIATGGIKTDNYYWANGAAVDFQTAAGNATEIQFKSGSGDDLAASNAFTFNSTSNVLTVTGNVDATNVNTTGAVAASGNVSGANITTGGVVTATGNVSGGNITTVGVVSATGNVTGANINTAGNVYANTALVTGNVISAGNLVIQGANVGITSTSGAIDVNNSKIINLATPVASTDAATKGYVDGVASGLTVKDSVRALAATNIALDGSVTTVDGVSLNNGDRVLVKGQTAASENGIYVADTGGWTRSEDMNLAAEFVSAFAFVEEGTSYADTGWVMTTNGPITVGTTNIAWTQFSGAGTFLAGEGLGLNGSTFNVKYDDSTIKLNVGDNKLYVPGNISLSNPNIGNATGVSLLLTGDANISGNLYIGGVTIANGNISAPNFVGNVIGDVQGNISGNITVSGGAGAIQYANAANALVSSAALNFNDTSNTLTVNGTVSATSLTGTLTTAAQPNVTSVGTLTGLTANGNIVVNDGGNANIGIYANNYFYANGSPIDFQTAAGSATEVQYKSSSGNDLAANSTFTFTEGTSTLAVGNVKVSSLSNTYVVVAGADGKLESSGNFTFGSGNLNVTGNARVSASVIAANLTSNALTSTRVVLAGADGLLTDNSGLTYAANALSTTNIEVSGTANVTGNLSAANANLGNVATANYFTGTLTTAAQPNITSVGTLSSLSVSGVTDLNVVGNVRIGGATAGQYLRATDTAGNVEWATLDTSIIANGTSNVTIPSANGNVITNVNGSAIITVSGTGANVTGVVEASGNVNGNNINATNYITANANAVANSSITGTVQVAGGIGATGNIYTGQAVGFANNNGGTASAAYIQFNASANSLDFIFN